MHSTVLLLLRITNLPFKFYGVVYVHIAEAAQQRLHKILVIITLKANTVQYERIVLILNFINHRQFPKNCTKIDGKIYDPVEDHSTILKAAAFYLYRKPHNASDPVTIYYTPPYYK